MTFDTVNIVRRYGARRFFYGSAQSAPQETPVLRIVTIIYGAVRCGAFIFFTVRCGAVRIAFILESYAVRCGAVRCGFVSHNRTVQCGSGNPVG